MTEKREIRRTRRLILTQFQLRYASLFFFSILVAGAVILLVLSFLIGSHLFFFAQEDLLSQAEIKQLMSESLKWVLLAAGGGTLLIAVVISALTFIFSHRIAGPVYALTRRFRLLAQGDYHHPFELRKSDSLQEIKEVLNVLLLKYRSEKEERIRVCERIMQDLVSVGEQEPTFKSRLQPYIDQARLLAQTEKELLNGRIQSPHT